MAQYTTSIKAMIELDAYKEGIRPYELRIDDYITRGRKLLFNFSYAGDTVFKEYFEKRFINRYLLENINNEYPPLWEKTLESLVQITAPLYYLKYQGLNQLTIDKMLSDGIRLTEISKSGSSDGELNSTKTSNDESRRNGTVNTDHDTTHRKTGTSKNDSTSKSSSSGSGSGSSTNVNSSFPSNVAQATPIGSINYKSDGGKVESSNTASNTDSSESSSTDTYNITDADEGNTQTSTNDVNTATGRGTQKDNRSDSFTEAETVNEKLTGNLLDKVMKLYTVDFNPVENFVDELYSKLFIMLW